MRKDDQVRLRHMLDAARDRLVHAYFDINLEILWQTVQGDLPPLVAELEQIVRGELDW
jgi:uncharacterized protein with HEPN domain